MIRYCLFHKVMIIVTIYFSQCDEQRWEKSFMDKEKKRWKFFSWKTLCIVVVVCVIHTTIWITFYGVPLMGLPQAEEVKSISITKNSSQERELTTIEDIERFIKAPNLLSYRVFGKTEGSPIMIVTYHLKNGEDVTMKANNTSMWWHEKVHPIKDTSLFINVVDGLFFD